MAMFRHKPTVVEAIQWTGKNVEQVLQFLSGHTCVYWRVGHEVSIETANGPVIAQAGDWILLDVKGQPYPCRQSIFEATYEAVKDSDAGR